MRYIDVDALIKKIFPYDVVDKKDYSINAEAIYKAIENAPTEDVVPKAEVEEQLHKIKQESTDFYCSFTKNKIQECPIQDEVEKAKQEVVNEIIQLIGEQSVEPQHYGYKDVRNDELAQLTIKILKKYKGE